MWFKQIIPKALKSYILKRLKTLIISNEKDYQKSYSQYAEDLILAGFINKSNGFFVDVGAHHPIRFSNTYFFYKKGWKGINIDATPNSMEIFRNERPLDINLEYGISETSESLIFHEFQEPALNTFSVELANLYLSRGEILSKKHELPCITLESLLDNFLPLNQQIDFLTVDAEGLDINVLKSNNWSKYIPTYIVVEYWEEDILKITNSEIYAYLTSVNYIFVGKTVCSVFFKHSN